MATRPGMRAGPPRKANDTKPSRHGQISRATARSWRMKAPARPPRFPVILNIAAGTDVGHHHRLLECHVDVLPLAGLLPRKQREGDADRGLDAAVVVGNRQ